MPVLRPWSVTASAYVVRDQWIGLRADDCSTSDGVRVAPYYVLEYPDWVHVVAISPDGRLLLIEQYRHGCAGVSLELPAGKIDPNEEAGVAAVRELHEETGCAGRVVTVLPPLSPNPATHSNRVHTVVVRDVVRIGEAAHDPTEVINARWVAIGEALALARSGAVTASMQIASMLLGLEAAGAINPLSARGEN